MSDSYSMEILFDMLSCNPSNVSIGQAAAKDIKSQH